MARKFNGSSDGMQTANVLTGGFTQLSVSLWQWVDTASDTDHVSLETSSNSITNAGCWTYFYNSLSFPGKSIVLFNGNLGFAYCTYTRPSAATWHHYTFIFNPSSASNDVTAYVDGSLASGITHVDLAQTGIFAPQALFFMCRALGSLFEAGRLAEVGLWQGVNLNSNEITSLAAGFRPLHIRPDKLLYYWPLLTKASPEIEIVAQNQAGLTGTTTTDHPRIIY